MQRSLYIDNNDSCYIFPANFVTFWMEFADLNSQTEHCVSKSVRVQGLEVPVGGV